MKNLSLHHLQTLVWISRLGTFSAAAARLHTTQPSISGRIRELEARLGIEIFRKEGRNSVLTVQGRDIVRKSEAILAAFEQMLPSERALRGTVRIGAGEIAAATILPAFLARLQDELPNVTLEVGIDLTAELLRDLMHSRLDLIFLPGPAGGPELRVAPIGSIDMLWVANPSVAATAGAGAGPADAKIPIWTLPAHSPLHQLMLDAIGTPRPVDRIVHHCNNVQTLLAIVSEGGGIAVVPRPLAKPAIAAGRLVPLFEGEPLARLSLSVAVRANEIEPVVLHILARAQELQFG